MFYCLKIKQEFVFNIVFRELFSKKPYKIIHLYRQLLYKLTLKYFKYGANILIGLLYYVGRELTWLRLSHLCQTSIVDVWYKIELVDTMI